jgi:hypothetical protein
VDLKDHFPMSSPTKMEKSCQYQEGMGSGNLKGGITRRIVARSASISYYDLFPKRNDQQTGMLLSGHKTASVYRRYKIPTEEVLRSAAEMLEKPSVQNPTVTKTGTMEVIDQNLSNVSDLKKRTSGA